MWGAHLFACMHLCILYHSYSFIHKAVQVCVYTKERECKWHSKNSKKRMHEAAGAAKKRWKEKNFMDGRPWIVPLNPTSLTDCSHSVSGEVDFYFSYLYPCAFESMYFIILADWAVFDMMNTPSMQYVSICWSVCDHLWYDMGFSEQSIHPPPSPWFLKQEWKRIN